MCISALKVHTAPFFPTAITYLHLKKDIKSLTLSWRTHHDGSPGAERTLELPPGAHTASGSFWHMRSDGVTWK